MQYYTTAQKMSILKSVVNALFQCKLQGLSPEMTSVTTNCGVFKGKWFAAKLYGMDFDIGVPNGRLTIRVIEQNPDKVDAAGNRKYHALLASQGHQIAWVIDRGKKENAFLGRIQDGEWIASKEIATKPATAKLPAVSSSQGVSLPVYEEETIPEIEGNLPEYILQHFAEEEPDWNDAPMFGGGYDPDEPY
jgi:hypothetical protein